MDQLFEILKYILPSLVVLAAAYYILKKMLDSRYGMEVLKYRREIQSEKIPLKLQAYERLLLFCDRIEINNLIYRLLGNEMTADQLSKAMLISIQKEYEHNIAQQIYVSDPLWKIIDQAKNNIISSVSNVASKINVEDSAEVFADAVRSQSGQAIASLGIAKNAIKEEVRDLLDV